MPWQSKAAVRPGTAYTWPLIVVCGPGSAGLEVLANPSRSPSAALEAAAVEECLVDLRQLRAGSRGPRTRFDLRPWYSARSRSSRDLDRSVVRLSPVLAPTSISPSFSTADGPTSRWAGRRLRSRPAWSQALELGVCRAAFSCGLPSAMAVWRASPRRQLDPQADVGDPWSSSEGLVLRGRCTDREALDSASSIWPSRPPRPGLRQRRMPSARQVDSGMDLDLEGELIGPVSGSSMARGRSRGRSGCLQLTGTSRRPPRASASSERSGRRPWSPCRIASPATGPAFAASPAARPRGEAPGIARRPSP